MHRLINNALTECNSFRGHKLNSHSVLVNMFTNRTLPSLHRHRSLSMFDIH